LLLRERRGVARAVPTGSSIPAWTPRPSALNMALAASSLVWIDAKHDDVALAIVDQPVEPSA
jgi:hypothetical protein